METGESRFFISFNHLNQQFKAYAVKIINFTAIWLTLLVLIVYTVDLTIERTFGIKFAAILAIFGLSIATYKTMTQSYCYSFTFKNLAMSGLTIASSSADVAEFSCCAAAIEANSYNTCLAISSRNKPLE